MYNIIISIFLSSILFADFVDIGRATDIARNFHNSRSNTYIIESVESVSEQNSIYLYIFKLDPIGFIIVSADDHVMPVLGYSFDNNFDSNNPPIQVDYLFDVYRDNINATYEEDLLPSNEISSSWDYYSNPFIYESVRDVSPLLTCNWNQDSPWNDMCPEDQDGPGGNVYAGCVAVSMAQVMYYWGYPEIGYGNHGYNPGGGYGYQYADYANTTYDYNSMEDNFATEASQLLLYHAGVAVNMGYSPSGSGAWVLNGSNSTYSAMKNYFIYDHSIAAVDPSSYSTSQYRSILQSDLDSNQPIIYRGCSNDGCHAWNIDGYEDDYFHNNFGWGGSNNGFYLLSALNGFNYDQGALINIVPEQLDDPHIALMETNYFELDGDGDDVINPSEIVAYFVTIENFVPWNNASSVTIALESLSNDLIIENESIYIGNLNSGSEYTNEIPFEISISNSAQLGEHLMLLHIMADNGNYIEQFEVALDVSLFQAGFPYDTFDQIKTNPLVIDIDDDGDKDIIFSDNMGFVHVVESDGSITNDNFPYEIGDDVWGAASAEDIDLDGDIEFVISSKSKSIYIFDKDGLENTYYADKYLLGTPVIGQIDSDPYFEIVIGSYGPGATSENQLSSIIIQVLYTLYKINKKIPSFRHNDLHLENIMIVKDDVKNIVVSDHDGNRFQFNNEGVKIILIDFEKSHIKGVKNHQNFYNPNPIYDTHQFLTSIYLFLHNSSSPNLKPMSKISSNKKTKINNEIVRILRYIEKKIEPQFLDYGSTKNEFVDDGFLTLKGQQKIKNSLDDYISDIKLILI